MSQFKTYLSVDGMHPIHLGSLDQKSTDLFIEALEDVGVAVFFDDEEYREYAIANPKPTSANIRKTLEAPEIAFRKSLLNKKCTVGRKKQITFPISYKEVEDISLEEACANLAIFTPTPRKKLPKSIIDELGKNQYISQSFIDKLSKADEASLTKATRSLVNTMLRENLKMVKSKIPASLGIGKPSEDVPDLNEAAASGSQGLSFLPNDTLINDSVIGEESFKNVIERYQRELKDSDVADKEALKVSFDLILQTLNKTPRGKTVCVYASKACKSVCLVASGQRYNSNEDPLGQKSIGSGSESRAATYFRMILGYFQTAFLANPYYFLRVLIEAVSQHAESHISAVCEYSSSSGGEEGLEILDIEDYLSKIPPSVRLNVYSDYPWELIYTDMFDLFDLEKPKIFAGRQRVGVQFYDYTKVPGRWSRTQTQKLLHEFDYETPQHRDYYLPPNYHLTFSFAGTKASLRHSELCAYAGQNTTYAFSSKSLRNGIVEKALKTTQQTFNSITDNEILLKKISKFLSDLQKVIQDQFDLTSKKHTGKPLTQDILPKTFNGYRVISGDWYDQRYLDTEFQKDGEAVIVGLNWKAPKNINININGKEHELDPILASIMTDEDDPNAAKGVGFGFARFGIGSEFELTMESAKRSFSIYLIADDTSREASNILLSKLSRADARDIGIDEISFSTEAGTRMNIVGDVTDLQAAIEEKISDYLDKMEI